MRQAFNDGKSKSLAIAMLTDPKAGGKSMYRALMRAGAGAGRKDPVNFSDDEGRLPAV